MIPQESINVLLVEDDPTAALLARELLQTEHGFAVVHVDRLRKALDHVFVETVDVVLLDLGLPDSQGLETLVRFRSEREFIPVIVMTSRDDEELALQAVHAGAQDYLVKTFVTVGALTRSIRYAIERNDAADKLRERSVLASLNADVGLAFTKGGSLREMLARCAHSMVRNLDAAFARVWTLSDSGTDLELQASEGIYTHLDGSHSRIPVGQLKIGHIAETRLPVLTNDVQNDQRINDHDWASREGMVAFAGYPLLVEDRVVGVMAIFARHALSTTTLDTMASVANHIAIGIERKQSEDAHRSVTQTLQSLLDAAPLAIVVIDRQARVLKWNAAAETIFGWSEDEVLGRALPFIPDDEQDDFRRTLSAEFSGENLSGTERRRVKKDGTLVDVVLYTALRRDADGTPVAAMGMFVDTTASKLLEEQLRQAQKMEAIGRLAGGVAHDFNNLLTIISGYSELLAKKLPPDSPLQELISEISQAETRAASLTRQLLVFSRKQVIDPAVVDLNELISNLERMLARLIGEDVTLTSSLDAQLGSVLADAGQMEQVLMNLAVNARDAMPLGGRLTIETRNAVLDETYTRAFAELKPGSYIQLSVSDTGTGMDVATRNRIFEPFFTTKGAGQGTGLGLATLYGIVKQSGGHVAVYTELGRGSTFKIYLPRVDEPKPIESHAAVEAILDGSETILLAEDEKALRELTRITLEARGYTVLVARNGEEALRVAAEYDDLIDIVLTDVVMPVVSGSELVRRISELRPGIKALFLSGYTDDAVVRHGVLNADSAFLQKPYSPAALAKKVREVLDR